MFHTVAAASAAPLEVPRWASPLSADELDRTLGGSPDPITLAALVFAAGVVVGIIDRILFGGCRCR